MGLAFFPTVLKPSLCCVLFLALLSFIYGPDSWRVLKFPNISPLCFIL